MNFSEQKDEEAIKGMRDWGIGALVSLGMGAMYGELIVEIASATFAFGGLD